ncbi:17471_t:CDS:2, partial [Gigaspora margarita]
FLLPNTNAKFYNKEKQKIGTLTSIANWSKWKWSTEGPDEGSICARALPNFGTWNIFSSSKIQKIIKTRIIEKPTPITSTHTQPKNNWTTLLPKISDELQNSENENK